MIERSFARGDETEIAQALLDYIDGNAANLVADEGDLYHYEPPLGIWVKAPHSQLENLIQDFAGNFVAETPNRRLKVNSNTVNGVLRLILSRAAEESYFSVAPAGLAFENGFLAVSVEGARLEKHAQTQKQRTLFPWKWSAQKSAAFEAFMRSFFRDDADGADKVAFIQELFGASLIGVAPRFQKSGLFLGGGENGKDSCLEVLRSVFPEEAKSAIAPSMWGDPYYCAKLSGKLLNSVGELPNKKWDSTDVFKAVITGSKVTARHPYGRAFDFAPTAGHVFAANQTTETPDFSHGFFRRFGVIRFRREFTGADRDVDIISKMVKEREAIVAWMIEGAVRLLRQKEYTIPASHEAEIHVWQVSDDNVAAFAEELYPVGETRAAALYDAYRYWCDRNGHKSCSSTKFGLRLKELLKRRKWGEVRRDTAGNVYPVQYGKVLLPPSKTPNPNDSNPLS